MGMYIPNMKSEQFYELCKEHGLKIIAVSVPPHGRLIDADALMDSDGDLWDGMWGWSGVQIANAPTILEAEEDKHDNDDH